MALFGFGKKKKEAAMPQPPTPPPTPPASMQKNAATQPEPSASPEIKMPEIQLPELQKTKSGQSETRHVDDLEHETTQGPLFPEIPKLDLPELEPAEDEPKLMRAEEKDTASEIELPEIETPDIAVQLPSLDIPKTSSQDGMAKEFKIPEAKTSGPETRSPKIEIPDTLPDLEEQKIPERIPDIEDTFHYAPKKKTPLFINVNIYKDLIGELNSTRAKLNEYVSAATRLLESRDKKHQAMEKWRDLLEDLQRKVVGIDQALFEGG